MTIDLRFIGPMPDLNTLTRIQVAFADNGEPVDKKGKGNRTTRYKAVVELWTCSPAVASNYNCAWKRNVALRSEAAFLDNARRNFKKGSLSQNNMDIAVAITESINARHDQNLYGFVMENNDGWRFMELQLVRVRFKEDGTPVIDLLTPDGIIDINNANTYFATGIYKYTARFDEAQIKAALSQ